MPPILHLTRGEAGDLRLAPADYPAEKRGEALDARK